MARNHRVGSRVTVAMAALLVALAGGHAGAQDTVYQATLGEANRRPRK